MKKYNIINRAEYTFYQIPKILVHGEKYKDSLTPTDIFAYSILMDRLNISIKNNWLDKEGNIYFVYTNKELKNILNVSEKTVINIKKKLKDLDLLEEVRTGRANRLYLLSPEVLIEEAKYIIDLDTKEIKDKSKYTKKNKEELEENLKSKSNNINELEKVQFVEETPSNQPLANSKKKTNCKNDSSELNNLQPSNNNLIRTKDIKDIKDLSDHKIISNSFNPKEKNKEIENQIIDDYIYEKGLNELYGERFISRVKIFSFNDFSTFKTFINKAEFAQRSVEDEEGISLPFYKGSQYFYLIEGELLSAFNRAIHQQRSGKVDNIASYLFVSFKTVFKDFANIVKEELADRTN